MGSLVLSEQMKPHAVCIPYPAQGHINPMLKLAKLLHNRGFHITFVNTEFNHRRLLKSRGSASLDGLPSFQFESIPDGLPSSDVDATQDIPSLCISTSEFCLKPFEEILRKLNSTPSSPPVSCVVSDGVMSFTIDAAEKLGVPEILLWTTSACGFLAYANFHRLIDRGYFPLKDESYLTNGYLETVIDWIPSMRGIRLKDIPSFIKTTNPDDMMLRYLLSEIKRAERASAIVLNTFDALEGETVEELSSILPPVYPIGPLHLMIKQVADENLSSIGSNLWKEEDHCLEWLDSKEPDSVLYVNFGSITVMNGDQLTEFAWGLAKSKKPFLWVIRPDLVAGESSALPAHFIEETKERGLLSSWCNQEKVLNHSAIGGFLTHSGWNSTIESISSGVPMLCWPFFAEQQTNCRFSCSEWGVGMEIDSNGKREEIESLVRELMDGRKGAEMKKKAMELKKLAEDASTASNGSSSTNLDKICRILNQTDKN